VQIYSRSFSDKGYVKLRWVETFCLMIVMPQKLQPTTYHKPPNDKEVYSSAP
jgi:hypothetical protein